MIALAIHNPQGEPYAIEVDGKTFGAWAEHESTSGLGYRVTFLRFGLAAPYDFDSQRGARKAAKAINALRSDWDRLSAEDIKAEGKKIMAICHAERGTPSLGPKGPPVPISTLHRD